MSRSHFLKTLPQFPFSSEKESTSLGWPTCPSPSHSPSSAPPSAQAAPVTNPVSMLPGCSCCLQHSPWESAWSPPFSLKPSLKWSCRMSLFKVTSHSTSSAPALLILSFYIFFSPCNKQYNLAVCYVYSCLFLQGQAPLCSLMPPKLWE